MNTGLKINKIMRTGKNPVIRNKGPVYLNKVISRGNRICGQCKKNVYNLYHELFAKVQKKDIFILPFRTFNSLWDFNKEVKVSKQSCILNHWSKRKVGHCLWNKWQRSNIFKKDNQNCKQMFLEMTIYVPRKWIKYKKLQYMQK